MNIFKEIINLCKDYFQKEKMMAKAYEEITEKMEDGITLADLIVDVLKENKKLKEQLSKSKEIIKEYMIIVKGGNITVCSVPEENRCINVLKLNKQAEQFLKEIGK